MIRGSTAVALLCAASLLHAPGETPDAIPARKLGKTQKIEKYGYSIRVPEKWVAIPSKPGETKTVGNWQPDREEITKRGDIPSFGCEVFILRYPVRGTTTGSRGKDKGETAETKDEPKLPKSMIGVEEARTLQDFLDAKASGRYVPKDFTAGRGKSKLEGQLLEFTHGQHYLCVATFRHDNYDWGIFYAAPEQHYLKEWKKLYLQSLKTFQLFEPEGEPMVAAAGIDKSLLSRDERRAQIHAGIASSPGWWAHDTDNYVFLTNSRSKPFIKSLGKDIEIIREHVYKVLFPPSNEVTALGIVRVFENREEYHAYGGPRQSAGVWYPAREELVLFEKESGESDSSSREDARRIMYHEAFHQYIHYAVGEDIAPHSWFNEGHGDFFSGMNVRGSRISYGPFDWRTYYLKRHLALDQGLIPIRSLVRLPQSEYYSNGGLKYSQGWALIYFLRNVTKNEEWQAIPNRYFEHLRDNLAAFKRAGEDKEDDSGENVKGIPGVKVYSFADRERVEKILEEAIEVGFDGVDYDELQDQYERWIRSIT